MFFSRRAAGARAQRSQSFSKKFILSLSGALVLSLFASLLLLVRRIVRSVLAPRSISDVRIVSADLVAQTITLQESPVTLLPGRYGLATNGSTGYLRLGSVLSRGDGLVTRKLLTEVNRDAIFHEEAKFSGWYYDQPDQLHLPFSSVLVSSPVGPCPAWLFPGGQESATSDIWVIQVHGWGSKRAECLRAVPLLKRLGFSTLIVSYRNDGDAPRVARGALTLGLTEWRDIDSAISFARRSGARKVILMGWSMGGAVVLQTLLRSSHSAFISGAILDSPVVDWPLVLAAQAAQNNIPPSLASLSKATMSSHLGTVLTSVSEPVSFVELDVLGKAKQLEHPILILHSINDSFVPDAASLELANARPELVDLVSFTGPGHTKIWNYDQHGWEDAISSWLSRVVPDAASNPTDVISPEVEDS